MAWLGFTFVWRLLPRLRTIWGLLKIRFTGNVTLEGKRQKTHHYHQIYRFNIQEIMALDIFTWLLWMKWTSSQAVEDFRGHLMDPSSPTINRLCACVSVKSLTNICTILLSLLLIEREGPVCPVLDQHSTLLRPPVPVPHTQNQQGWKYKSEKRNYLSYLANNNRDTVGKKEKL